MADQSKDFEVLGNELDRIEKSSKQLYRAGYAPAIYETLINLIDEMDRDHRSNTAPLIEAFEAGKQDYKAGKPFRTYAQHKGLCCRAYRAGWLSAASVNATLLQVNEKLLLNAAEFLETLEISKTRLNDLAGNTVSEPQRHELTSLLTRLNFVISTFDGMVNPPHPKEKQKLEKQGGVAA